MTYDIAILALAAIILLAVFIQLLFTIAIFLTMTRNNRRYEDLQSEIETVIHDLSLRWPRESENNVEFVQVTPRVTLRDTLRDTPRDTLRDTPRGAPLNVSTESISSIGGPDYSRLK